jgi:hypothetical protein
MVAQKERGPRRVVRPLLLAMVDEGESLVVESAAVSWAMRWV